MALTKEEREFRIKLNEMLDRYSSSLSEVSEDAEAEAEVEIPKDVKRRVEMPQGLERVSSLGDLQKVLDLNKMNLAFLGKNSFSGGISSSITVSIFMMSTKWVTVPENDNLIVLGYEAPDPRGDDEEVLLEVRCSDRKETQLESFMELPIVPDNAETAISSADIVKMCNSAQFYRIYQEDALDTIRKMFPYPYGMFTGPHLYRVEDKKVPTLYVTYDEMRKRFRYGYNPDFILKSAIEEWMISGDKYKSLKDCYCYLLAFFITHEMLHIIHHNTVSDTKTTTDDSRLTTTDREVANVVQDSFINCKIARRFSNAPQLRSGSSRGLAPIIQNGVGSKISVRVEHNKGLKRFDTVKDLALAVGETLVKNLKLSDTILDHTYSAGGRPIGQYVGADIFVTVDIKPWVSAIRNNSSNLFQSCFNDIIKAITDGKAHEIHTKISDAEKKSDLDVIPVGKLVLVRKRHVIGIVSAYNAGDNTYEVNLAKISGTHRIGSDEQGDIFVTDYTDSGEKLGTFSRIDLSPYSPEKDAFYKGVRPQKQTQLTPEDLASLGGGAGAESEEEEKDEQGNGLQPKILNLGDIVWVRSLKKFGKIVGINDGVFKLEEVVEKPCKVLDDSMNYT